MEHLKLLRKQHGLSQQKLAELLNTTQQSVYKYENDISQPDIQMLIKMSQIFHTSIDYIVGNTSEPDAYHYLQESDLTLTEKEIQHLQHYRSLSEHRRDLLDALMDDYINEP